MDNLLHATGLAMCDQELARSSEKDVNGEISRSPYGSHGERLDGHQKIPCPWACGSPEFTNDEDLYAHIRLNGDTVACPNLSRMVWDATTPELIHNLSQMIGHETNNGAEISTSKRVDPHGRFLYFTSGFLTARGIALQTPMFTLPYPFSKFMWEWATTDKPDSQTVVNSFHNKLQHQPTVDLLKVMDPAYRPSKFFTCFTKGKHGKTEKSWRPLHEWLLQECVAAKYIFFKLEHPLRKAGDSVMVVLVVKKMVAICFDPKCMLLNADERAVRDVEILNSVKRLLDTLTKKFQRNLLRETRKPWDDLIQQPLAVYAYASPWMEDLVKKVAVVEHTEYLFELLTLAFYNRCTMQEANCYEDPPTESIPVPTFFLEAVSDIVTLLSSASKDNGDLKDEFWRELIEWGLSRTTYEALFQNALDAAAPISELLAQSSIVGKSPQIPSRLQMSNMEHEFRLLENDTSMVDSETGHEPSPGPNSIQDGITSSLVKKDSSDEPHMMGSDRSLRPVAARKSVQQFHIPYDHPYHMSGSKRKSTVPTKNARSAESPEIEVPSRALEYGVPGSAKRRRAETVLPTQAPMTSQLNLMDIQPLKIAIPRLNGHSNSISKVKKESLGSDLSNFNMPPAVPIPAARPSQDHIYQSEMLTKLIQPKTSRQSSVDTHSGAYQCLQCHNYGSSDLTTMKDHIREHLGLCPFQCYHCHRAFTCFKSFKAHADVLGIPYFQCIVCTWQTCDEADMHRHTQDEHLELPKCRREDLYGLLHFYKASSDLKSWDDYIGAPGSSGKQSGSSSSGKTRLETVMNGSGKK